MLAAAEAGADAVDASTDALSGTTAQVRRTTRFHKLSKVALTHDVVSSLP